MTPELKKACEVVFQEHKASADPIKWSSDTFRGRISLGLSDLAKDTLVKKKILWQPEKSKRPVTVLNPAVVTASSFEEAEAMIKNKTHVAVATVPERPVYISHQGSFSDPVSSKFSHRLLSIPGEVSVPAVAIKWYLRPVFYYLLWPVCAAGAGALITYLIDFAFARLFLN